MPPKGSREPQGSRQETPPSSSTSTPPATGLQKPQPTRGPQGPSPSVAKPGVIAPRPIGISTGAQQLPQKVVIYGPGGVGKTELAANMAQVGVIPGFLDLDEGSYRLDVTRTDPTPETYEEIGEVLAAWKDNTEIDAVVVDSLTKAEEFCGQYTLRTVPHEKGHFVDSLEGYGWGKGFFHVYENFLLLLQALDAVVRVGKHVVCICHDCTANVPNPGGEDWIQYQPRLQSPPSGKGSIRHRVKEWCDHLLYVGFDTFVSTDGKAQGTGSRTIYCTELPTQWAKSRSLSQPFPYPKGDSNLWQQLFPKGP